MFRGIPPTPLTESEEALLRYLARCRRRTQAVLFLRYASVAVAVLFVVNAAAVRWPTALLAPRWGVSALAAVALAAALTLARTPTLRTVGVAVDRRLQLADLVVTALTLAGERDPIARLIVRSAAHRLSGVSASRVVPLRIGRPAAAAVGAATLLGVLLIALSVVPDGVSRSSRPQGRSLEGAASGRPLQAPPPEASADGRAPTERIAGAAGTQGTSAVPSDAASVVGPTQREQVGESSAASDDRRQPAVAVAAADRTRQARSESGSDTGSTRNQRSSTTPDSGRETSTARLGPSGAPSASGGSLAGAAPPKGTLAGGGANASETGNETSGGVRAGALVPVAPQTASTVSGADSNYDARYRQARARAEAAIAREEVPLSRRSYVRDYFLAIRPKD